MAAATHYIKFCAKWGKRMSESLHILTGTDSAGAMKTSNALERCKRFKCCWKDVRTVERTGQPTSNGLADVIKCMSDGSDTN